MTIRSVARFSDLPDTVVGAGSSAKMASATTAVNKLMKSRCTLLARTWPCHPATNIAARICIGAARAKIFRRVIVANTSWIDAITWLGVHLLSRIPERCGATVAAEIPSVGHFPDYDDSRVVDRRFRKPM